MTLEDLFVSHKQVDPVVFDKTTPSLSEDIYLNLDRAQRAAIESAQQKTDYSTWRVGNKDTKESAYKDWTVGWKKALKKLEASVSNERSANNELYKDMPIDTLDFISFFENYEKPFGSKLTDKDLRGYALGEKNAKGRKTFGYGLLFHPDYDSKFMEDVKTEYTQAELEELFKKRVAKDRNHVTNWAGKNNIKLSEKQITALTAAVYNFGSGFLDWEIARKIAKNPNDPSIYEHWANQGKHQWGKYPGLKTRRRREANMYAGIADWKNHLVV